MLTSLALYTTLGLLMSVLGFAWTSWQFWSVLALFWANEQLVRQQTREQVLQELTELQHRLEQLVREYRNQPPDQQ